MKTSSFQELPISSEMKRILNDIKLNTPTPIQSLSIPVLMKNKDLRGQSKTGSGKTFAYSIPIIDQIDPDLKDVQALIICPTRELANQVVTEMRKLGRRHPQLTIMALTGGAANGREQAQSLRKGVHIAVGTPGRLLDHLKRDQLNLEHLRFLVLDEADKLLEMGFEEDVDQIVEATPEDRQSILFSATFPEAVLSISRKYQKNPETPVVEEIEQVAANIEHLGYMYEDQDKEAVLLRVLNKHACSSIIIFCNTKIAVNKIHELLKEREIIAEALHGDIEQKDRERIMATFKNKSISILVCTDVAARGIDVDNLEVVINFDVPDQVETYVHRAGRTGRAGKTGTSISLFNKHQTLRAQEIEEKVAQKIIYPKLGFENQLGLSSQLFLPKMQTLIVFAGRKDKIRPGDVLGALTNPVVGLKFEQVGKIEIHDHLTYVAIERDLAVQTLEKLRQIKIKARKIALRLI